MKPLLLWAFLGVKSTLIRCLNLLNRPTKGNIYVDGENIVEYDQKQLGNLDKQMAMVFNILDYYPSYHSSKCRIWS